MDTNENEPKLRMIDKALLLYVLFLTACLILVPVIEAAVELFT